MQSPLIVYIHVPKAAGSTVNKHMYKHSDLGIAHCESIINTPEKMKNAASQFEWISGHVPLSEFEKKLGTSCNRKIKYFSSIRNPATQVASHYNWLIEIFHRAPDFYNDHPDHIKAISETIRKTDNTNPKEIIKNLIQFSGLFLNFQSRIVLGDDFNWNEGYVHKRLNTYTFISTSTNLSGLLKKMTGNTLSIKAKENASRYHFDKDVFKTKELRTFLLNRNFLDHTLYQAIQDRDSESGV